MKIETCSMNNVGGQCVKIFISWSGPRSKAMAEA